MSVKYILDQAGAKMGLNPSDTQQRTVLLRFLNEAAPELYDQADAVGSLYEQLFKINGDQTVSFPSYLGEIRAARSADSFVPFHINQMRPRYNTVNWADTWRNYRIKNEQTLSKSLANQSVIVVSVHAVENPPIEVTISGPTDYSDYTSETLVMDATSKATSNQFNDITAITKNRVNDYNITIYDVDANEVSSIPNNQLQSSFLIIDVSIWPFSNNNGGSNEAHYVEVLYKKRLPILSNDADEYPCKGFDNILVNKMMQLWKEEQDKPDAALLYDTKATRTFARKQENENAATEDCIALVPNPHDTLVQRTLANRPGFYPIVRSSP